MFSTAVEEKACNRALVSFLPFTIDTNGGTKVDRHDDYRVDGSTPDAYLPLVGFLQGG
jgi:hypothetical protein